MYVKTMSCSGSHLGIPINIKNTKFVKDLPMIDAQFRFNQEPLSQDLPRTTSSRSAKNHFLKICQESLPQDLPRTTSSRSAKNHFFKICQGPLPQDLPRIRQRLTGSSSKFVPIKTSMSSMSRICGG
jgi:hypothetical protein